MQDIEEADDMLMCASNKRKGAIKRRGYEIIKDPEADEAVANQHAECLKYFWSHVQATNAVDMNQVGGWSLFVEQLMDSVAKKYAIHEVIWKPSPDGLTARFNFVPLWFFENRTGKLRFLTYDFAFDGIDLETVAPGGWLVTVGQHVMSSIARNFLRKQYCLNFWLMYCETNGQPGIAAKTTAGWGTPQWLALETALASVGSEFRLLMNKEDDIDTIQFGATGTLPFEPLIERMDRATAALYRGADLSTMSAKDNAGASLQGDESDMIEQDDARWLSETINEQVEKKVIEYTFGVGTKPLAYLRIVIPPKKDVKSDIEVDDFLLQSGAPLGVDETLERYGRERPDDGSDLLKPPAKPVIGMGKDGEDQQDQGNQVNESPLERKSRVALAKAYASEFINLRERLQAIGDIQDVMIRNQKLIKLRSELHNYLRDINQDPDAAKILEQSMIAAFFQGMKRVKKG
jgi:hypothetical protein